VVLGGEVPQESKGHRGLEKSWLLRENGIQ
jgi:hypothetical protein